jgi:hypothetical protein
MAYAITKLSERLYLIRWSADATTEEANEYLAELAQILDQTSIPIYFISDLRRGCITQLSALRRLANLATHPNWGGSTAFGSMSSAVFSSLFERFTSNRQQGDRTYTDAQEAITYLETLFQGITAAIDWERILSEE